MLLGLGACRNSVGPDNPYKDPPYPYHQIAPLPWYREVWDSVARCAKQSIVLKGGQFKDARWFEMEGGVVYYPPYTGEGANGAIAAWYPPDRIFFARTLDTVKWIVAHESLHMMGPVWDHGDPFPRCIPPFWQPAPTPQLLDSPAQ